MFLKNIISYTKNKKGYKNILKKKLYGDDSYVEIPLPIPNREVKHVHVEDSAEQK